VIVGTCNSFCHAAEWIDVLLGVETFGDPRNISLGQESQFFQRIRCGLHQSPCILLWSVVCVLSVKPFLVVLAKALALLFSFEIVVYLISK